MIGVEDESKMKIFQQTDKNINNIILLIFFRNKNFSLTQPEFLGFTQPLLALLEFGEIVEVYIDSSGTSDGRF